MVLKTIFPGCGVWASLMLFLSYFSTKQANRQTKNHQKHNPLGGGKSILNTLCILYMRPMNNLPRKIDQNKIKTWFDKKDEK